MRACCPLSDAKFGTRRSEADWGIKNHLMSRLASLPAVCGLRVRERQTGCWGSTCSAQKSLAALKKKKKGGGGGGAGGMKD